MKIGLKPILSLALLATILVPAAAVVLTGVGASRTQNVILIDEEVSTLGFAMTVGVDGILNDAETLLHTIARLDETGQSATGLYNNVKDNIMRVFENAKAENEHLLDVIITDTSGMEIANLSGRSPGAIFKGFEETANLGKTDTYTSDITKSDADYNNTDTFYMLCRINDGEAGDAALGFLSIIFDVSLISEYLKISSYFGELPDADMFVTDRKGTAVWLDGAETTLQPAITTSGIRDIVGGIINSPPRTPGSRGYNNIDSNGYIGAYGNVGKTAGGWYWFSVYPVAAITAIPGSVIMWIIIAAVISLICLVFMVIIIHRITSPLRDILKTMHKINNGDMHERFEPQSLSEYAYISESFNEMMNEVLMGGELHRAISELSDNMLFEYDYKRQNFYVSDNFLALFDLEPTKASLTNGRFIESLMDKEDCERFKIDIDKMLKNLSSLDSEYQVTTKTGGVIWISVKAHCVLDRLNQLLRVIGVITNINSEKLLSLQLSEKASYDFLSGLYNRSTFMRELQIELERSVNSRVGVIFIDVDDFKFINDRYGHSTGDEIIKHVAKVVKDKLGSNGFAGRFGGDEFVMCVTNPETIDTIGALSRIILDVFAEGYYHQPEDVTLAVKASFGIAIAPEHGKDNETILAAADEAMYFVKKNGKSNFHIHNPDDSVVAGIMHSI